MVCDGGGVWSVMVAMVCRAVVVVREVDFSHEN